jgi:hypothetical protein
MMAWRVTPRNSSPARLSRIKRKSRVLDEDDGRNVVDDGFAELPGAEQRAQIIAGVRPRIARKRRLCHFVLVASGNGAALHRPSLASSDHHGGSRLRRRVAGRLTSGNRAWLRRWQARA